VSDLPVGGVRLRGVSRSYDLRLEHNMTLKETIMRGRRTRSRKVHALREIDLDIEPGTALGVVGSNGAGKSTLLTVIAGILPPDTGTVETSGRVVSLLELGAGFHPDFTGRENVVLNASIHGMTRAEIEGRMDDIIAFSEMSQFIDAPVRTYSSGMYTRLGFAVASCLDPDILLLDEILAVGDAAFQQKCIAKIAEFQRAKITIVFVSHSGMAVKRICDRAIWLQGGRIDADDRPDVIIDRYEHGLEQVDDLFGAFEGGDGSEAEIVAVRLMGADGPQGRFMSGERFQVEVEYAVKAPVTPVVSIVITTTEGGLIGGTDNRLVLDQDPTPGRRRVTFTLDELPLLEGRFRVAAQLEPPSGGRSYHRRSKGNEFAVFAQTRGYGPVALPGDWTAGAPVPAP
jgi:ABC-2 type transport system ATP-binding protein